MSLPWGAKASYDKGLPILSFPSTLAPPPAPCCSLREGLERDKKVCTPPAMGPQHPTKGLWRSLETGVFIILLIMTQILARDSDRCCVEP